MPSKSFYAVIAGAGSGTGRAAAVRFSKAYPVVLLARNADSYNDIVDEINENGGQAIGIAADATDAISLDTAFKAIQEKLPDSKLAAAVFNVNSKFARKSFLDLSIDEFDANLSAAPRGLFVFAQKTIPLLLKSVKESEHPPTLLVTGATASVRGSSHFGHFAASKFGLRGLTQSLSREFHPQGVHVAHAIIDGVIDIPRTKGWNPNDGAEDGKIRPEQIADDYWHLHTQHRSGFTQEIDLRPYVEKF